MDLPEMKASDAMTRLTRLMLLSQRATRVANQMQIRTLAKASGSEYSLMDGQTLATMIDFTDAGEIGVFIDDDRLEILRGHMEEKGYPEAHHLQDMFSMLRENDLFWSFFEVNYLRGTKTRPIDLLFWNSDSTLSGVRFIPQPDFWGGEVEFVLGGSGHIAGVINPPSEMRPKYGFRTADEYPDTPDGFLKQANRLEGSWWPYWSEWIKWHCSGTNPARKPGAREKHVSIKAVPGSYVLSH